MNNYFLLTIEEQRQVLQAAEGRIGLPAQAIEKDLKNWGNKQQFLKEDHDVNELFHFLDWALCVLIVYIDNPFKAKKCLEENLQTLKVLAIKRQMPC